MTKRLDHLRRLLAKRVGKPAVCRSGGHHRHPLLTYGPRPRQPAGLIANARRGVGDRQTMKTLRRKASQPQAGQTAHRDPAEPGAVDIQVIEQRNHILPQLGEGHFAIFCRFTVAVRVVAQHPEMGG